MAKSFKDLPAPVQAVIFVAGAAVLAGLTFWYYVLPMKDQRDKLKQQVDKLVAENRKNQAFEQERTEYLNQMRQLVKQLETRQLLVPDEPATDEFMKVVFQAGAVTGVNIRTFIPQAQAPRDFYIEMPFTLRLDGTYYTLVSFFDRLAHDQRIVSVSGLGLGAPGGGGMGNFSVSANETVGANCVVTTYYNRQQAAAPPPKKK
jgi:type IV pilus assembly protein PilO